MTITSVAVLGTRGGSGKSTIAHLVALGAVLDNRPVVLFETDPSRQTGAEIDSDDERPYIVVDGLDRSDPNNLDYFINIYNKHFDAYKAQNPVFVIDGAAARAEFDAFVASSADVVLLPCREHSHDLAALTQAWPILNAHNNAHIVLNGHSESGSWKELREKIVASLPAEPVLDIGRHDGFFRVTESKFVFVRFAKEEGTKLWNFVKTKI